TTTMSEFFLLLTVRSGSSAPFLAHAFAPSLLRRRALRPLLRLGVARRRRREFRDSPCPEEDDAAGGARPCADRAGARAAAAGAGIAGRRRRPVLGAAALVSPVRGADRDRPAGRLGGAPRGPAAAPRHVRRHRDV